MKPNQIYKGIMVGLLLVIFTAVSAQAGKVTVKNSCGKTMGVMYESWLLGINLGGTICAEPGKTEWVDNVVGSIGKITTMESIKSKCTYSQTFTNIGRYYTPSGTYLPHRKFHVTFNKNGTTDITEE